MGKMKDKNLYLVISEEYGRGRSALDIARQAIAGGADIIQMREKNKPREELIRLGIELAGVCRKSDVIFIVNDDPMLAHEVNAGGVHLGQEDLKLFPISSVRKILGKNKIIGVSTHSVEQFETANNNDIDYIAFGPIFPTLTKNYCIGTNEIAKVLKAAKKPVFFIGGINLSNIGELVKKGARNIAVIRVILEADDIKLKTEEMRRWLLK